MTDELHPLSLLVGDWSGTNRMRLMPDDPYTESPATAQVRPAAHSHIHTIAYTWTADGEMHDGLLLLGPQAGSDGVAAVWCDSWHQSPHWMTLSGGAEGGDITVRGDYGEDAGWRIHLAAGTDQFVITMHNVVPGHDYPVVEARYHRAA